MINSIIDKYYSTTRFAFTCNDQSNIIEALQSRCTILHFDKLSQDQIISRLENICHVEGVEFTPDSLVELYLTCNGDLRKAINNLQLIHNVYGKILTGFVEKVCDRPNYETIGKILDFCKDKDCASALRYTFDLRNKGFSTYDIIITLFDYLMYCSAENKIEQDLLIKYMSIVSEFMKIICKDIDSRIQLSACIIKLIRC